MNVVQATEFTALIIGIGGAGTVLVKGARMARRFGHFIDKLAGNGDREPGILKRLDDLQSAVDDLTAGQVILTQQGDDLATRGDRRDAALAELKTSVDTMGDKLNAHCDTDAVNWRAEGEAWGRRIDARLDALEGKQDPVTKS